MKPVLAVIEANNQNQPQSLLAKSADNVRMWALLLVAFSELRGRSGKMWSSGDRLRMAIRSFAGQCQVKAFQQTADIMTIAGRTSVAGLDVKLYPLLDD